MSESVSGHLRSNISDRPAWASLPHQLMDAVLQNLQCDMPSILQTRRVCKAWRDACSSFSGPARFTLSRDYDTVGVSNTLPGLQVLGLSILATRIYLPSLSALSRLTSLRTVYAEGDTLPLYGRDPLFDLVILPSGLRTLELLFCHVDPQSFKHIKCTALTRLVLLWTENRVWEIEGLLQHLPLLQDLNLGQVNRIPDCDIDNEDPYGACNDFSGFFRCRNLRRLRLDNGELHIPFHSPACKSTLRQLCLNSMTVAEPFIYNVPALLPNLTELFLFDCDYLSGNFRDMRVISTLRSLQLLDSGPRCLALASPQLESFVYGGTSEGEEAEREEEEEVFNYIVTFSGLTKLDFRVVHFRCQPRFEELHRLGLRELNFNYCTGVAEALNHLHAFAVLQKLCIVEYREDEQPLGAAGKAGDYTQDLQEVLKMREAVFNLPSLMELSGRCRIFSLGLPVNWKLWRRNDPLLDPLLVDVIWRRVA